MPAADSLFLSTYMALEEAMRLTVGHSFNTLIRDCTFRGISCRHPRFEYALQTIFHLCIPQKKI
jgi:hypothetical protein